MPFYSTLIEEHRMELFENGMIRIRLGSKRKEVGGE
jgi:hypothetical protein